MLPISAKKSSNSSNTPNADLKADKITPVIMGNTNTEVIYSSDKDPTNNRVLCDHVPEAFRFWIGSNQHGINVEYGTIWNPGHNLIIYLETPGAQT